MSRITTITTKIKIDPIEVCKLLANEGYGIVIKDEKPTAKIYMPRTSIRETEITEEENGYEIRLPVLACKEDFHLYRDCIKHILQMTNGKAIYEGDEEVKDAMKFFDWKFINNAIDNELTMILELIEEGEEMCFFCPSREFWIGKNIFKQLSSFGDNLDNKRKYLYELIRKSQYEIIPSKDTPVFAVQKNDSPETEPKKLTMYRKNEYNYITFADYFAIMDENKKYFITNYSDMPKFIPDSWKLFDEKQYQTQPLTDNEWNALWIKAKKFETSYS